MPSSRSFPRALIAACATALLVGAPAPAQAAQNPTWLDATTAADGTREAFGPRAASADGRTVVVWTESDGANIRVASVIQASPQSAWSAPEYLSPAGVSVYAYDYRPTVDLDGNVTVYWQIDGSGNAFVTRTLPAGATTWADTDPVTVTENEAIGDYAINARADGGLVLSSTSYHGEDTLRFRTRAAGASTWGDPVDIDQSGSSPTHLKVAYNASGDGLAIWQATVSGEYLLRASRYDRQNDTWSPPAAVTEPVSQAYQGHELALSPTGAATVLWVIDSADGLETASVPAGSNDWELEPKLTAPGYSVMSASIASDRNGDMVAAFQSLDPNDMAGTSRPLVRTRDAQTGVWSDAQSLTGDDFGGGVVLAVDRNYNMLAAMLSSSGLPDINVSAAYRPDGADAFNDDVVLRPFAFEFSHGLPLPYIDNEGNAFVTWPQHSGGNVHVGVAAGDASGPDLRDLSVPASGTVGEPLTFSVNPFDLFSGVDATTWSFGDGGDASGSSVTRTYAAAGTYTVTVSARDLNGLESSTTRSVTITDPPIADAPDTPAPPKVLAPVIEARLSGRTVTLNAKVALRAGKSCSGRVNASLSFGNRTYRTTLKLKRAGKSCVGTGTIKLKKTPSTRTKLRVTISAKTIKTRTLTTKR